MVNSITLLSYNLIYIQQVQSQLSQISRFATKLLKLYFEVITTLITMIIGTSIESLLE